MGSILGLGLSHYPGPLVPAERMVEFIPMNIKRGLVPPAAYEDVASWPEPMRQEWADDRGAAAGRGHRERLLAGYRALRAELDSFAPDLVLILNWVCLAGAMTELDHQPSIVDFVETHLFNSSKCFAVFSPAGERLTV